MKPITQLVGHWWQKRTRLEKIASAAVLVTFGGAVMAVILPEVAIAAAGGAMTAAAAWVVHKGFSG